MVDELNSQAVSNNLESSLPGMPPQNAQPAPQSPGKFDFMMKEPPKRPGKLSSVLSSVPKAAKISLAVIGVIIILVILYSVFLGGKTTNSQELISIAAQAQEIARVSELVNGQTKDGDALGLSITARTTTSSQEAQLKAYLTTQKIKVDPEMLLAKVDKNTDRQLATALQNNNYEQAYYAYLKTSLKTYQDSLNTAYQTVGPKGKAVLSAAYQSNQFLLSAAQLE